ncbi:MFS transporter superfamily [Fusarium oxysporum f. sp. vasinfectum]|nr:MFS transporter superfamily [Fusarium oxysporum f. sp. vasinfectum]
MQKEDDKVQTTAKVQNVAYSDAIAKDNLSPRATSIFKLYAIIALVTLNNCGNGFDGTIMSSINAMDPFHKFFGTEMQGSSIGAVFALYSVGNILGCLVAAPAADIFGRKFGMITGSIFVIIGTVIQAAAQNVGTFMAGRLFLGFGCTIAVTASPIYLVEMAYPSWRGTLAGLYNVGGWYIGSLASTWTAYGTGRLTSNWSWRIPIIIQVVPRVHHPVWQEQARAVLIKYHGDGNPESAVVKLELDEMRASIEYQEEIEASQKWWDYRMLFDNRENLHRFYLLFLVAIFSQFIGGSVITYYMPVILENVGITSSSQQLLLNGVNVIFGFFSGVAGSFSVEKFGRRPLFLWGTFLTGLVYIPINVIAAKAHGHVDTSTGYAFIAMIFLYGIFWSFCWTPLQSLYPSEVLRNDIRAKGMAASGFFSGVSGFINTYATPVALQKIGWKTYTIFLILHFVEWGMMYFALVETKGRSLEEIDEIFKSPNPVKTSKQKHEVYIKEGAGVTADLGAKEA